MLNKNDFWNTLSKLFLVVVIMLFLGSCAKKDSSGKEETLIVVSLPGFASAAPQWVGTGAKKYVEDHPELNIKLIIFDGQSSGQKQLSQIEGVLPQSPAAVVFWGNDVPSTRPIMTKTKEADVPVVVVCSILDDDMQAISKAWVGSDDAEAGVMQMEMLKKDFNGNAKVAVLEGGRAVPANTYRLRGYDSVVKENKGLSIVESQEDFDWSTEEALKIAENWIQSGLEFDAVVGVADSIAMGAVIASENTKKPLKVYGVDATPLALEAVKSGRLAGTVYQDMIEWGYQGVDVAYKVAKGEKYEPRTFIPLTPVNSDNIDEIIKKAGERDALHTRLFKAN